METLTIGMAEAKTNFSRITAKVNETGRSVVVFKNNKPWVEIRPLVADSGASGLDPETREALLEAEAVKADPGHERFVDADSFFKSLGI